MRDELDTADVAPKGNEPQCRQQCDGKARRNMNVVLVNESRVSQVRQVGYVL